MRQGRRAAPHSAADGDALQTEAMYSLTLEAAVIRCVFVMFVLFLLQLEMQRFSFLPSWFFLSVRMR